VRLRQVSQLVPSALHEIRNCIQAEPVHTHIQPEAHHIQHLFQHRGIVVIQIGLVRNEAMQ